MHACARTRPEILRLGVGLPGAVVALQLVQSRAVLWWRPPLAGAARAAAPVHAVGMQRPGDSPVLRHYHARPCGVLHPEVAVAKTGLLSAIFHNAKWRLMSRECALCQVHACMGLWRGSPYPTGGIACVGMKRRSLANMAESDSKPFARLMSDTWREQLRLSAWHLTQAKLLGLRSTTG
jgi:hypothetical protein